MTRTFLALCLAASAAGCASGDGANSAPPAGLTVTEHYAINLSQHEDQILLAPHAQALSQAQSAALQDLVYRWREYGDGVVKVQTPAHGGEDAYRAAALVQDALYALGVRADQVSVGDYDAGPHPHAPLVVGFVRYQAQGPQCGRQWDSYTATKDNGVTNNFGCANTANVAALVANPADLITPRGEDPADGGRREVVLGRYRQGQPTSTTKDEQASGAVSNVAQ
jgi:pilus assembly protein CpaD